jgi:HNH endonuclease
MSKIIKLTQGFETIVDDDIFEKIGHLKWCARYTDKSKYVWAGKRINNKIVRLHRFIMNPGPNETVDHINNNPLDNRKENLRICSLKDNSRNTRAHTKKARKFSKFKGVSWLKSCNKWRAYIVKDNKQHHLGCHADEIQAAKAYNTAAKELFGEFARFNEIG